MPMPTLTRMDLYDSLVVRKDEFLARAEEAGRALDIPPELRGRLGTSGASSALPGTLRADVMQAMQDVAGKFVSMRALGDEIRRLVKSVYGDGWDAAPTNSCEAALEVVHDALLTPPQLGRGDTYRARCVGLLERHAEHHLSYGRPFPPKYKEVFSDRGSTAGELGLNGRRALNTDIVFVPMAGARYDVHGPKMIQSPMLLGTDAARTLNAVERAAQTHASQLAGFVTLGYDTPGYGYGERDAYGVPRIQSSIGALAASYDVPYVVDNAWGAPFIGSDPRKLGADVMLFSMDKVAGAPTSGLMIGREGAMVNVRRALGFHSERFGTVSSHGKGTHASADPGKLSLAALVHVLRVLRDEPQRLTDPIDRLHDIVQEECTRWRDRLGSDFVVTRSHNLGGVELNYERTWSGDRMGIPIFTNEDRIAGANLMGHALARMGIVLSQAEDGNVIFTPGLGTVDANGALIEPNMRLAVRAVFTTLALLRDWAAEQKPPA
ncbi:hypothetical protein [Ramlibacter sp.]|uniref:hypothetical protein n=1 Tax=Ramlibacter sp. TaxID=1917967 RepID=UPI003D10FE1D